MRKLLRLRPSASLIIATAALVAALSGGAYATGTFSAASASSATAHAAAGSDTKSDKKIANKAAKNYFKKHIAGASVSHANKANSANTAASATNAGTANNANALGGLAPATFLGRVSQRDNPTVSFVSLTSATPTDVTPGSPATITVPSGVNFVLATASGSLGGLASESFIIWIADDSNTCSTPAGRGYENRPFGEVTATDSQQELSQTLVFPETPGVHTFRLCAEENGGAGAMFDPVLDVYTIPAGATGGTTLAPVARGGPAKPANPKTATLARVR